MSNDVVFVPEAMYEMAADLEIWADDLRATADDVEAALNRFRSSSSEFVPPLPAHGVAIDSAADLTVVLAENVGLLGAAAEEADREGVTNFGEVVSLVAAGIRTADTATSMTQGVLRLVHTSVHGTRAVDAGARTWNIARQFGGRSMPDIKRIRAMTPGGATMARTEIRAVQLAKYRELKATRRLLLRRSSQGRTGLRTNRALTGPGRRVQDFLKKPGLGRGLTVAGRVLGGVGAAVSAVDAVAAATDGDTEEAITKGVSAAGSVMLMTPNPVVAGAGAVLIVGAFAYDKREEIGQLADRGADAVVDGASSVVKGAGRVLGSIF